MHSDSKSRQALKDIRDNVHVAQSFVEDVSFEQFLTSRLHVYAAIRALEIISEAARRLSPAVRSRHPDLPWRSIMDAGNVYRHAYDNVGAVEVWRTIENSLAPLLAAVLSEIDETDRGA